MWHYKHNPKETVDRLDFIKIKISCLPKEAIIIMEQQTSKSKKTFANYISNKGLLFRICSVLLLQSSKRPTAQLKLWATFLNRHFSKEIHEWLISINKRNSASFLTREMLIKTMVKYPYMCSQQNGYNKVWHYQALSRLWPNIVDRDVK